MLRVLVNNNIFFLMLKNHIRINPSLLQFIKSNNRSRIKNSFFDLLDDQFLINSFPCESDSTLGAGEYSFLIYGGQYLTLYNIDGPLYRIPWNTNIYDSIKQIRWSTYHRSYLIMTARVFSLFVLYSYELFPIKRTVPINEQLQLFACHQADLWLVCLLTNTKKQILVHYDLSDWERNTSEKKIFSLDKLGLYRTDQICAIENNQYGEILALLIAERNQNLTVGIQRRRRLILISIYTMSLIRVIYFSGADDLYWTLTPVRNQRSSKTGWLLNKWFDNELTFVDDQLTSIEYRKALRNLAITIDGHYLILRTIDSLDIYQLY